MKILIACEYSGIVRDAFAAKGHDAWSCDILPTESPGNHFQGDILEHLDKGWDMMIAHPPCTHLAVSGARWFTEGKKPWSLQEDALDFVRKLLSAPINKIGSPIIKSICHSRFSNTVDINKASTGITTPTYPALPGPTFSNNLK